jgi:biopolymer transport protein ExbB
MPIFLHVGGIGGVSKCCADTVLFLTRLGIFGKQGQNFLKLRLMKKLHIVIPLVLLFASGIGYAQPAGYNYVKVIQIDATQVSEISATDLTDFPVLVSISGDQSLRAAGDGGRVRDTNGYDIVFYTNDCSSPLDFEVEQYTSTGGGATLVAWVKVPTLSATTNTVIGIYYGNSGISTPQSPGSPWTNSYISVYHLNSSFADALGVNDGVNNGSTDVGGKIANGKDFDGSSYVQTPSTELQTENNFTVSTWFKADVTTVSHIIWEGLGSENGWGGSPGTAQEMHLSLGYCCPMGTALIPDRASFFLGDEEEENNPPSSTDVLSVDGGAFTETTNWHYMVGAISDLDGVSGTPTAELWLDGGSLGTNTGVADASTARNNWDTGLRVGSPGNVGSGRLFDGQVDEVRISNVVRSDDWIDTEFRNQDNPSNFYSLGPEVAVITGVCVLPIELLLFEAIPKDGRVKLIWSTASETNNDHFTVERSANGSDWEEIAEVDGAGTSNERIDYSKWDENPLDGVSYYRLKQTDSDETVSYSWIRKVDIDSEFTFKVYPNPSKGEFIIETEDPEKTHVQLHNNLGQPVSITRTLVDGSLVISAKGIKHGAYYLQIDNGMEVKRQIIVFE